MEIPTIAPLLFCLFCHAVFCLGKQLSDLSFRIGYMPVFFPKTGTADTTDGRSMCKVSGRKKQSSRIRYDYLIR